MSHQRSAAFAFALLALTLAPVALLGAPVAAEDEPPARLQLVLDASGSMRERAQGGTRLEVAKRALTQVVRDLPSEAEAGLRVYGATIDSGPGACTDSQEVVPPGTGNRDALLRAVREHKALGETPIGYALQEAAKDLGTEGRRTIVLVSDGEPTCDPDPCEVARSITAQGVDVKIDVIGLDVSEDVRRQLACIADAGNGTYYDADDAATLTRSLDQLSTRAFRPFQLEGVRVHGTPAPAGAPVLDAGQYLDEMPRGTMRDEVYLHYRIRRSVPGSTIHVGTTLRTPAGGVLTSYLSLADSPTGYCSDGLGQVINVFGQRSLLSASTSSGEHEADDPCSTAETLHLKVSHSDDALAGEMFELVVYEEPPLTGTSDLEPTDADTVRWRPMPVTRQEPVDPGLSMSDAPILAPGSYEQEILTGETQVFAVPLTWGERLQVEAVVPPRRGALAETIGNTASMETRVFDPVRAESSGLFMVKGAPRESSAFQFFEDAEPYRVGVATAPVAYGNRSDLATVASSLPGLRFVEVSFSGGAVAEDAYLLRYRLNIATFRESETPPPAYESSLPAPPVPAPAEMVAAAESGTASGTTPSTTPTPEAANDAGEPKPEQSGTEAEATAGSTWPWWVGGLAAVTLLAVVAVRLARRSAD